MSKWQIKEVRMPIPPDLSDMMSNEMFDHRIRVEHYVMLIWKGLLWPTPDEVYQGSYEARGTTFNSTAKYYLHNTSLQRGAMIYGMEVVS